MPGFRVVVRDGDLALLLPGFVEARLEQQADGRFLVAHDVEGPSKIEFGDLIDGAGDLRRRQAYRVSW